MRGRVTGGVGSRVLLALLLMSTGWLVVMSPARAMDPQQPFHSFVLDHWGVEQGLPQITVLGMAEDRAGFLWVNTQTAVARFDGARFVRYDRASTGVDTSMLNAAWADPHGGVWFGGARGLIEQRDGQFKALGGAAVNAIIDAGDGTPLLATADGVQRLHEGRMVSTGGSGGPAFSLLRGDGHLWIGGTGRVCRRADSAAPATESCIAAGPAAWRHVVVNHLALQGGQLWLGTSAGLMRIVDGQWVAAGLGDGIDAAPIESLLTDRVGSLWIATAKALYRRLPDGELEREEIDVQRRPWVHRMLEDRDGNLWLGTYTRGLYRIWNGWTRRLSLDDGVRDPLVWSVLRAPDGSIVFGTNSDVEVFDGKQVRTLIPGSALPNPSAYELYYDRRQRLWVGTRGGIAVFDRGVDVTPSALQGLRNLQINDIHELGDDDFLFGTSAGLYRWRQGALSRLDPQATAAEAIIRSVLPLAPGRWYVGTRDGVREWRDGHWTRPAWAEPLRSHFVTRLALLKPDLLAVATSDAGIGLMADGRLRMTGQSEGLPSDNVWTFDLLDGQLYASSTEGAWRLPLSQLPLPGSPPRTVSPQQLAGEQRSTTVSNLHCCNGGARARSAIVGDVIWYATTDGILGVNTRALGERPSAPRAAVVSVEHDDRQYTGGAFTLDQGSRDLTVHYTAPYLQVGTLHFRYRLDGYDKDWQHAGVRREAFYTHLPAGNYRFRVAATLPGAAGYGPEAAIAVEVAPYWYENLLVRLAAAAALVVLLFVLTRWSMRRQRRRNAWLEEQVERRTGELSRALERLRVTNLALAEESHTDTLTALHNRRYLLAQLPALLAEGSSVGVIQIDIDHFKHINDARGHAVGDAVLRELGGRLAELRRDSDITVRWGGEEFLLLLRDVDQADVLRIAQRLRHDIAAKAFADGRGGVLRLTCSIGFSMHPLAAHSDAATFDAAVELADLALYRAKYLGRDQCVGLLAAAPLPAAILRDPLAPQLDALLAAGQLKWVRPTN